MSRNLKTPAAGLLAAVCIAVAISRYLEHRPARPHSAATVTQKDPEKSPMPQPPSDSPYTDPIPAPSGEELFAHIGDLSKGENISLPLPDGSTLLGKLNYVNTYDNGATTGGGILQDGSGTFEIAKEPWGYRGFILQKDTKIAYVYSSSAEGRLAVASRPRDEVICEPENGPAPDDQPESSEPENAVIYNNGQSVGIIFEPIPILNSLPRAAATIYLDFDGEVIEGQAWEGGERIVATAYNLPASEVIEMWQRVAEDYAPFEVNVTTDLQVYQKAPKGRRVRCITTPTKISSGGGIAYLNSFQYTAEACCWNYYRGKSGSLVISHEVGHSFDLSHDGTSELDYYHGHGSGATSWGPIMGAPYSQTVCQWSKGDYPDANQHQDDIAIIGATAPLRQDDHFASTAYATPLTFTSGTTVSNSGIISSADDIDRFIFTTGGGALNLSFTGGPTGPDLDIEAKLYNESGTLVYTASPAGQLTATMATTLSAGTYTLTIDGVGNETWDTGGYDDYSSIGAYSITGTIASPGWRFQIPANAQSGAVLGTVNPGNGSSYSITGGNTGSAFSIDSQSGEIRVLTPASLSLSGTFDLTVSYSSGSGSTSVPVHLTVSPIRGMKAELYTGISGSGVAPLLTNSNYPDNPAETLYAPNFQANYNGNNIGERLTAYLIPPVTGNYTFWTEADDASQLYLSTDDNPANKVRIAYNNNATDPGVYTSESSQTSATIALVAGQRYYIEGIFRENTGYDHFSVAWQPPSQSRQIIANEYLEYPGTLANRAPWLPNMTYRVTEGSAINTAIATLTAGDFEPGSVLSGFTITSGNTGNAFSLNPDTGVLSVNGTLSFATLPKYYIGVKVTDSGGLTTTAEIAVEVMARAVKREVWNNVTGKEVEYLTALSSYPDHPDSTSYISMFEAPQNVGDNYGQRLSGYLRAPETGSYTFWIASDDDSELWMSSDSDPANKSLIAYALSSTGNRSWETYDTQKSATIQLTAGEYYYMEVLQKEGTGNDYAAVAWSGPDFDRTLLGTPHVTQEFYNHAAPTVSNLTISTVGRQESTSEVLGTVVAQDWSDPGTQITYTITSGNDDGAFSIDPITGEITRNAGALAEGTRQLTVTVTDNEPNSSSATAIVTINIVKAGLKREVWTNLSSTQSVSDLTGSLNYPQSPSSISYTSSFEAPSGIGDNYGQRLSGYLTPPTTGAYTFWIASDDGSQLYLSTDANPANKRSIANVVASVSEHDWTSQTNQQSASITLQAGQSYYIEALHKEGAGGDYLAVAWQGPSISQAIIPSTYLDPDLLRPALKREVWESASGVAWTRNSSTNEMKWTVNGVAAEGNVPPDNSSSFVGTIFSLKGPTNVSNNFSERITGYLVPPTTGDYTFWIASDDDSRLSLSTDENPENLSSIAYVIASVDPESWDVSQTQKSTTIKLVAGNRYYLEILHRDGTQGDHLAVAWQGPDFDRTIIGNAYLEHPSTPSDHTLLKREIWNNITGNAVSNLTSATTYPASPDLTNALDPDKGFVSYTRYGDSYGQRVSGYLTAPENGRYRFWLASDDGGELWLSTDDNPANRVKIASVSNSVSEQVWDTQASQKSRLIALTAGKRYYIEALHKENLGGDHLAVAWQGPSFDRRVIGNTYLESPLAIPSTPSVKREIWTNVTGESISDLTPNSTYKTANPDSRGILTSLEGPVNFSENFGERLSTVLTAPESGYFKFWISSDGASELWLSTDDTPENRLKIASADAATSRKSWNESPTQESGMIELVAGQRYYLEVLHQEGTGADHVAVAWQGPSFSQRILDGKFLEYPGTLAAPPALKRELWYNVTGNALTNLTTLSTYPNRPSETTSLTEFRSPTNVAETFGEKISGYLIPRFSGSYQFWIASDDEGELWLSTTESSTDKVKIASANVSGELNFSNSTTQESAAVDLVAGERYYIEALHKEGIGSDYAAVAWAGPNFNQQVISGDFLEYPGKIPGSIQSTTQVAETGINPSYRFWMEFAGVPTENQDSHADPDHDGIPNALEFVLGGNPAAKEANAMTLLPKMSYEGDWVIFEFRQADVASAVDPFVEYGTSLESWTRAISGTDGIEVTTEDDAYGTGIDRVIVKVPRQQMNSMFMRLNSNME
ncbi:cadherin domain-containing protein [Luteolibacter pohnpeiensis]|uniref:Cadherin domain-containing protein n=1 Tax=Luteolibacter pohnpeiensis TaxID=454153 RepID=A0A934S5R8_9BACT|nr:PA14 domain-containing protein [Luteolibacter pohnpeiensis]MBK1882373.1 cadherin domain-containing protein [Luteolibacter pohnpeiensis]